MKRPPHSRSRPRPARHVDRHRGAGRDAATRAKRPTPGWKGHSSLTLRGWRNPRAPSVPASLDLNQEEYYAAASLIGLLSSQVDEPDHRWCCEWSFKLGRTMAAEAQKRRRRKGRTS